MTIATAGFLAAIFSLPSGVIRAIGGWMSDHFGARAVMYWILGISVVCCALLIVPRMDIQAPGQSVIATRPGVVTAVSDSAIEVGGENFQLAVKSGRARTIFADEGTLILPTTEFWQEPAVDVGDEVVRKQLLARGVTHIYFQANVWVFTGLVCVLGIAMGIGKAAVYRHIPDYFPSDVGVVGGIVGVLGGLGGFVCPIIFGYLLEWTGIWTTCWVFFLALTLVSLIWMHLVVRRMMQTRVPELVRHIEHGHEVMPAHASARPAVEVPPALEGGVS
jgi:NNP family nitrate/nitrite transporter-like MFS transporter